MITQEMIAADAVLNGLTDEQKQALMLMSKNDEEAVIGNRFREVYNQLDATIIQRAHSDIPTGLSEETLLYGDIDGNAEVDLTDATFIQRYVAEMEIPYAVGKRKG